jgi:hypothetical protein
MLKILKGQTTFRYIRIHIMETIQLCSLSGARTHKAAFDEGIA